MLFLYFLVLYLLALTSWLGSVSITLCTSAVLVFSLDDIAVRFAVVLVVISCSVLTWSYYYMSAEVVFSRFFGLVIMFLISIFLLVFSSRLLGLFIG